MSSFHTPVMLKECLRYLEPQDGGVYVDATLGGGGHSLAMLEAQPQARLYCFDQDEEAIEAAAQNLAQHCGQVDLIRANFSGIRTELALRQIKTIDGALFDLGVSSHQLDRPERGFSFDNDAPLDMRMDGTQKMTAAKAVQELDQAALAKIFKEYGEELNAGRIARAIVTSRGESPIVSTGDLARIIEKVAGTGSKESLKTKVRVFQALRIYVNGELDVLRAALLDTINILKPGARIVVLSYHSLEDRIVKNALRDMSQECQCPSRVLGCSCGKKKLVKILTKSPLVADEAEVRTNKRSRSAKLRAAERIQGES
ncbi:MAG: 16S rRNA (cytosine(1402)-N(4))-methyltransferase RsmH [Candidatus Cloacimonetes bacterium]|jgi:16S rRNA (cytosine1402-N4)-methyltransferase|nr:16S rRNA (cytosine(1402)-N(4))-methyltransferase RsmH [Candidatus Cloacimonadota bacterium]